MKTKFWKTGLALVIVLSTTLKVSAYQTALQKVEIPDAYTDEALIKKLPGFSNHYDTVNGIKIHYVAGGKGKPLFLLPGWPETWYAYHLAAPILAAQYRVYIVDIRGMGTSDKPQTGYDKKTMAADLYALTKKLGIHKAYICGHDIGAMVAYSFAANYPNVTEKLIIMEGSHPNPMIEKMPMLPAKGTYNAKMSGKAPYAWWFAFNQTKGLPEKLLEGRSRLLIDWLDAYVSVDPNTITDFDRSVYAAYYDKPENIRGGNGWYQSFTKDIEDSKAYHKLTMPVLGVGSYIGYGSLKMGLPSQANNFRILLIRNSGHYIMEEQPKAVIEAISGFLK